MNSIRRLVLVAGVLLAIGATVVAAPPAMAQAMPPVMTAASLAPASTLATAEAEGLVFMVEEEKLAHDVYLALHDKWGLPTFKNIAGAEQTHMDAVRTLLERYGVKDPTVGEKQGVFANATLQGLYDQLVKQGSQSLADALRVGATIEDLDLADLQKRIAQTDKADIKLVYENLMRGSRNHLRSFSAQLRNQTGETYAPQYITQAEYDAIVGGSIETGGAGYGYNRNTDSTNTWGFGRRGGWR